MNRKMSHSNEIRCWVPQGSNLGPILFLLYINDLSKCLESAQTNLFADDIDLACAGSDPSEIKIKLKNDLKNVHNWLKCNKLTLNDTKTEYMIIGSGHRLTKFENISEILLAIGDDDIKRVTRKKSLGFIINDQLKWGMHIDTQCKKISKNIALLGRANSFFPLHTLIKMYNALVFPHMTYFLTVWNERSNSNLNKLSKLQRRASQHNHRKFVPLKL